MSKESTLRQRATCATTYWVDLPERSIEFALQEGNAAIDGLLKARGLREWAFLTAYNPHAEPSGALENQRRLKKLMHEVRTLGFEFLPGRDVSDDPSIAPEACLFIFGISAERAQHLGQRYGQAAVIVGQLDHPPQLLYAEKK